MLEAPANRRAAVLIPLGVLGACCALLAGCGGSGGGAPATVATSASASTPQATSTPAAPGAATAPPAHARRQVTLYFSSQDGNRLVEETRSSTAAGSELRAALVELATGPRGDGIPALPKGTVIVGTAVRGGQALVNLSGEFAVGYPSGGAAAEFAVLAPLVYTATAVDGVRAVRITVDGQTPAPAGSQFDWSRAFVREDFPEAGGTP